VLVLVALIGLILLVFGAQLSQQVGELAQTLPESMAALHERLQQTQWGRWLLDEAPGASQVLSQTDAFSRMTGAATSLMHGLVGLIVVLFVGLYGAAAPGMYLEGMVRLFPFSRRERAREALQTLGYSLRRWLLGQLFTMLLVGVLIGVGLWLLGVRQALALGLIAFVLELIPNFGPVLAAVPALLIAWSQGTTTLVYVLVLYVGAQALESYVVNPLVQQRAVWMPPILTLLAIVFFGLIGGLIGAFVATPLMLSIVVLVKLLYVEDLLGDRSIEVPGEPE
jgi:predicted PurR-regulated permease PerM